MIEPSASLQPFTDFQAAVEAVLRFLQRRLGFSLWMLTRREGEDWIVLVAVESGYGVESGSVFCWSDSFCARMVNGLGPRIAPVSQQINAYATAPIGGQIPIGAYIGLPLYHPDGSLFGTLCAIDPQPQPATIEQEMPLLALQAQLLSSLIASHLQIGTLQRSLVQAQRATTIDPLTGLRNRYGWQGLLEREEEGCRLYGSPALVAMVEVCNLAQVNLYGGYGAGDQLLQRVAQVLLEAVRPQDQVGRLGGSRFAVLAVEVSAPVAADLMDTLKQRLRQQRILAEVGWAMRLPQGTLTGAMEAANLDLCRVQNQRNSQGQVTMLQTIKESNDGN